MKHAIKFIYVAAFLLILALPLLFLNTKANAVSEVDNRTLVSRNAGMDKSKFFAGF